MFKRNSKNVEVKNEVTVAIRDIKLFLSYMISDPMVKEGNPIFGNTFVTINEVPVEKFINESTLRHIENNILDVYRKDRYAEKEGAELVSCVILQFQEVEND